ncbi:hypothetical protein COCON_G00073350 [Conger conger]|uniref:Uncharacterized protein n=1 Tax=Conger conger TaxID=82655 RepID=A0A9Q1DN88_CONCO|nr:hypothetical protein COCON_G00073350 [Conger conger]
MPQVRGLLWKHDQGERRRFWRAGIQRDAKREGAREGAKLERKNGSVLEAEVLNGAEREKERESASLKEKRIELRGCRGRGSTGEVKGYKTLHWGQHLGHLLL